MIALPRGVRIINEYPFTHGNLTVDTLGKPTDWKEVINNLHNKDMYERLASRVRKHGPLRIVCPKPAHNTHISSSRKLRIVNTEPEQIPVFRGSEGDGALIEPNEMYALASADCPAVGITDPNTQTMVAVHFSREAGIDGDILEKALGWFPEERMDHLTAVVVLGIAPKHFNHPWSHPVHGKKNKERCTYLIDRYGMGAVAYPPEDGYINLRWVAAQKLIEAGVRPANIHVDTLDTYGDPHFWSHKASQDPTHNKYREQGRNLVLIGNINKATN